MEWFLYDSDLHHERAKGLTQDTTNFLGDIDGLEDYHLTEKKNDCQSWKTWKRDNIDQLQ